MSKEINGFITWIRSFLDDIYAEKGSSGTDLELNLVPKSQNSNGVICISGGNVNYDLDKVYPIGSIYMSVNSANPSTLFGGTWVQLTDTFLYATSTTADANSTTATDGEATHKLTIEEMPKHNHTQAQHRHDLGSRQTYGSGNSWGILEYGSSQSTYTRHTGYATPTINDEGGDGYHNNMPPYMKVYIWKRTA